MSNYSIDWEVLAETAYGSFEINITIEYTYSRGREAVLYGDYPQPAEPSEIEITDIKTIPAAGKPLDADHLTWDIITKEYNADGALRSNMIENAVDAERSE